MSKKNGLDLIHLQSVGATPSGQVPESSQESSGSKGRPGHAVLQEHTMEPAASFICCIQNWKKENELETVLKMSITE